MLYRKIISTFLSLLELTLGLIILILWTIAYPLLRIKFLRTNKYKDYPSLVLFKAFVWTNHLFKYDYFKK